MIAPPLGIRDHRSPSPSLPLFCRLIANSASPHPSTLPSLPFSLPTPFSQQLLASQLPAAGAGEVVGGEGGGAQLASGGWPTWGSGSPVRPGAELSVWAIGSEDPHYERLGTELQLPLSGRTPSHRGAVSIADCSLPPTPNPASLAGGLTLLLCLFSAPIEPFCRASGWDSRPPWGRCGQRGTARGARGGRSMREPAKPGGC